MDDKVFRRILNDAVNEAIAANFDLYFDRPEVDALIRRWFTYRLQSMDAQLASPSMAAPSNRTPSTQDDGGLIAPLDGAAATFIPVDAEHPLPDDLKVGDEVACKIERVNDKTIGAAWLHHKYHMRTYAPTAYRRANTGEKKDD